MLNTFGLGSSGGSMEVTVYRFCKITSTGKVSKTKIIGTGKISKLKITGSGKITC